MVVAWPLLAMVLCMACPVALSTLAISKGMKVDTSLDSFKIQEHPIAEIYVSLPSLYRPYLTKHLFPLSSHYFSASF
jgi:hypothetical protein